MGGCHQGIRKLEQTQDDSTAQCAAFKAGFKQSWHVPVLVGDFRPTGREVSVASAAKAEPVQSLCQIAIFDPSSTTALFGKYRKSAAALALWCICANNFSRQGANPPPMVGITVSRDRK